MSKHRPSVLVIGAGAAGLSAARDLARAGARLRVLEARSRIGGRIFTLHRGDWPVPIELGAEFIHGRPPDTLRIARDARLLVDRLPNAHWVLTRRGLKDRDDFFEQMSRITSRMKTRGPDRSAAEFLAGQKKLRPELRSYFKSFIEGFHAAPLDKVSERSISTAGEGPPEPGEEDQFRIVAGYDRLAHWLLSQAGGDATLTLGTIVTEIAWRRGRVRVSATSGRRAAPRRFEADRVLVTVPVSVLRAPAGSPGALLFRPAVKEKERALAKLETGDVAKIVLLFRERFWEEKGLLARRDNRFDFNFLHARGETFPTWWTAAPAQTPTLTGWVGGPSAETLLSEKDETVAAVALGALGRILKIAPRRLAESLEGWHFHNWKTDPFSRGAYSFTGVGGTGAHRALARPVAGTLFFAGEATDPEQNGTVAGAIASGRRAAREILGR